MDDGDLKFRTPDGALWHYIELRHRMTAPRAFDPVAQIGLLRAPRCARCLSTAWVETRSKDGDDIDRCRRCGRPWDVEIAIVPKGVIQTSRRVNVAANMAVELATIERVLSIVPLWPMRAWRTWLLLGSLREAAFECRDRWPRAPFGWSKDRVSSLARSAQRAAEASLLRSGLMD